MPVYDYRCRCGARQEIVRPVKDWTRTMPCECGEKMTQVLGFRHVIPDIEPYRSMITGERIRSRAHHKAHLKQHGCIEIGNEPIHERKRKPEPLPPIRDDIQKAINQIRYDGVREEDRDYG